MIDEHGEATVHLAGRPFRIKREFIADLTGQPQAERIRQLRRPLMVLHAPEDAVVSVDNARRIFETALHPKSFISLDGADHLLNNPDDAGFAAAMIAAWAQRYLPGESTSATAG